MDRALLEGGRANSGTILQFLRPRVNQGMEARNAGMLAGSDAGDADSGASSANDEIIGSRVETADHQEWA